MNLFSSHIAKYFSNSIREEGLIAIGSHGVVIASDSPGTVREVFEAAEQNSYWVGDRRSPMVVLGRQGSSSFALLTAYARRDGYADLVPADHAQPGADVLDRGHEWIRQKRSPESLETEGRAGNGVCADAARIVVGCAGDETGAQDLASFLERVALFGELRCGARGRRGWFGVRDAPTAPPSTTCHR